MSASTDPTVTAAAIADCLRALVWDTPTSEEAGRPTRATVSAVNGTAFGPSGPFRQALSRLLGLPELLTRTTDGADIDAVISAVTDARPALRAARYADDASISRIQAALVAEPDIAAAADPYVVIVFMKAVEFVGALVDDLDGQPPTADPFGLADVPASTTLIFAAQLLLDELGTQGVPAPAELAERTRAALSRLGLGDDETSALVLADPFAPAWELCDGRDERAVFEALVAAVAAALTFIEEDVMRTLPAIVSRTWWALTRGIEGLPTPFGAD